ncbi:MAG: divergent PAP2 family protein [Oscillospiraceae bacterium]|nr:divergent PAP2 family protein [Oscillospiraceae bacterium]
MYNSVIICGALSWLAAQIIKTLLHACKGKKIVMERIVGSGGMPSSHTALVLSTLIAVGRKDGVSSTAFGIMFVVAAVVIYDAMGVRRAAGLHAKELNRIVKLLPKLRLGETENDSNTDPRKELTELLGHTPLEVLGGAVVGIIIALIVPIKG